MAAQESVTQRKKGRSPSYPAIDLETAIARARELWQRDRFNSTPVNVILQHWDYAAGSSNGLVTLAALIKFGLLADEGAGDNRKARLTEVARRILLDDRPNSPERDAAIKDAALTPKIHKDFWDAYVGMLPSDENLRYELRAIRGFTDTAVIAFIKELRSTWTFAKLAESAILSGGATDKAPLEGEKEMTPTPGAVVADGESKPKAQTLMPGSVKYSWPLSKTVTAEITIIGTEIGVKDLEMLRKYLDLAKDALKDQGSE